MNDFNSYGKPINFIPDEIKSGDLVLLVAFGAGITWGACLIRW